MLKPKVVSQVLRQATTGGVEATLLLNSEGSLLAFAANSDREAKVYAAIASNVWSTYERCGKAIYENEELKLMLIECEEGKVAITTVSNMVLCLVGQGSIEFGLLRAKANALTKHLEEPLKRVNYQSA
ncbi:hypothetical protein K7432_010078 [Basidiobolus ranarum]|uniref:Roadblock/LAMTOR2 domain-containing protein n=1 Tax=Basidiobolus ranarum TaxID=34480 RepID=A0ABR2VW29_9FUNG